jgi:hypothetical protein
MKRALQIVLVVSIALIAFAVKACEKVLQRVAEKAQPTADEQEGQRLIAAEIRAAIGPYEGLEFNYDITERVWAIRVINSRVNELPVAEREKAAREVLKAVLSYTQEVDADLKAMKVLFVARSGGETLSAERVISSFEVDAAQLDFLPRAPATNPSPRPIP